MRPVGKDVLYQNFNVVVDFFNLNKKVKEKVESDLEEYNILVSETKAIMNRNNPVQSLDYAVVFLMLNSLYEAYNEAEKYNINTEEIGRDMINPETYFTDFEIS
jgi:hypothetical protein